tara:strand:- start:35 stop:574 length:540 start_codon:yes stop_codon:yes gene_type:complete
MLNKILSFFNASSNEDFLYEDAVCKLQNLKVRLEEYEIHKRKQPISQIKDYFSDQDNRKQFIPDGEPFQGEFDSYFDIRKDGDFYGFYRISLLPKNSLEIHCGFTRFNSLLARRYLKVTELVLRELQELFPKYVIISECLTSNEKANNYLLYFCFELIDSEYGINSYVLNRAQFKKKFH